MNTDNTRCLSVFIRVHLWPYVFGVPLEQELQAELYPPRAFRRWNLPEGGRAHEIVGQIQIHMIQQIECLGAELHTRALAQSGGLDDGHVDVLKSRARHYVPPGIAEAAERRHRERGGVEPMVRPWLGE